MLSIILITVIDRSYRDTGIPFTNNVYFVTNYRQCPINLPTSLFFFDINFVFRHKLCVKTNVQICAKIDMTNPTISVSDPLKSKA